MTPRQQRVIQQTEDWVQGKCVHNVVDDECCPDFSCCRPELFTEDRAARMDYLNKLRAKYGVARRLDA